jgi:hypothetical protein
VSFSTSSHILYQVAFHEAIKVELSAAEKHEPKIFARFREFRGLETWFLQPTAANGLERSVQTVITESEDVRKRRAHKKVFTEVVLPKLKQFKPRVKQFIVYHCAADEIGDFVDAPRTLFGPRCRSAIARATSHSRTR